MSIIDLYDLFIHNPQITTDSRNCPKGSIFFALKAINSMEINMPGKPWHPAVSMPS